MATCMTALKTLGAAVLVVLLLGFTACGGGSDTAPGGNLGGTDRPPEMVGDITPPPAPEDYPQQQPVSGTFSSAPLGTNPLYEVQEAEALVETHSFTHSGSSVKGASQEPTNPFEVLWVALAPRDTPFEEVVAGRADPQEMPEGSEVDLYIAFTISADQTSFYREWIIENAELQYIEPDPDTLDQGDYYSVLPFTIPYGTASLDTSFIGAMSLIGETVMPIDRGTSVVLPENFSHYRWVDFEITGTPVLAPVHYPSNPDADNDVLGGCLPDWLTAEFGGDTVHVESEMELSNVVLEFADGTRERWDNLDQDPTRLNTGNFWGTGENEGKDIEVAWVKVGCNESGEGPGYGERCEPGTVYRLAMAQMAWEDLMIGADYDYNDFVGRLRATELRNVSEELVQVHLTIKALARASGYDSDWQFNIDASFPTQASTDVIAIVDQYYADGTRHGNQRVYVSAGGMSIPIFSPISHALPSPPGTYCANGIPGTLYVDGDWAEVTIILNNPLPQGSYTPMPYKPELLVQPAGGGVYKVGLWTEPGDPVGSNGMPLAFIVPDTYAWPLEGKAIRTCYGEFDYWIQWINDQNLPEPLLMWYDDTPVAERVFSRDKFLPWPVE